MVMKAWSYSHTTNSLGRTKSRHLLHKILAGNSLYSGGHLQRIPVYSCADLFSQQKTQLLVIHITALVHITPLFPKERLEQQEQKQKATHVAVFVPLTGRQPGPPGSLGLTRTAGSERGITRSFNRRLV